MWNLYVTETGEGSHMSRIEHYALNTARARARAPVGTLVVCAQPRALRRSGRELGAARRAGVTQTRA